MSRYSLPDKSACCRPGKCSSMISSNKLMRSAPVTFSHTTSEIRGVTEPGTCMPRTSDTSVKWCTSSLSSENENAVTSTNSRSSSRVAIVCNFAALVRIICFWRPCAA